MRAVRRGSGVSLVPALARALVGAVAQGLVAVVALSLVPVAARAQDDDTTVRPHSLRKGAWAVQFRIANNFQLVSFAGSTLSIKRHLSDRTAVELGVSVDFEAIDGDQLAESSADTFTVFARDYDFDRSGGAFDLSLLFVSYPRRISAVNLFLAAGPVIGFTDVTFGEDVLTFPDSAQINRDETEESWRVGLHGALGVEWFITRHLSLSGRYGLAFAYETRERESRERSVNSFGFQVSSSRFEDGGFRLRDLPATLGLSAYF